jgi:hypothetical protein
MYSMTLGSAGLREPCLQRITTPQCLQHKNVDFGTALAQERNDRKRDSLSKAFIYKQRTWAK